MRVPTTDHYEGLDPFSGPFTSKRDLPLTFRSRTDASAIAALGLPPTTSARHADARNAVLTEARLAGDLSRWVSFSRRRAAYVGRHRYHGDSFRFDAILSAVADGVNAGLLEEERASPGTRGRQSRFRATPLLRQLESGPIHSLLHEVIWLKDHNKQLVNYADNAQTTALRKEIEAINGVMAGITVELAGPVDKVGCYWVMGDAYLLPSVPRVFRVFNRSSFRKGGRLYGWFQNIPAADRARLLLNGQPVLEPDYAQIHAQIIYALRDIPLVGDAYETGEFPREFGKRAFNIAVNARSFRAAVAALTHELRINWQTATKLVLAVKAKHRQVADIFCTDAGVDLMRIDSEITLEAVKQCLAKGIVVLPVHDSLIVQAQCADQTAEIMTKAFATHFPRTNVCEVRVKSMEHSSDGNMKEAA